jgi:hypothetical protein
MHFHSVVLFQFVVRSVLDFCVFDREFAGRPPEQPAWFTNKFGSFDQFDLTGSPDLVEPRFERAVEAQDHEPALAGNPKVKR